MQRVTHIEVEQLLRSWQEGALTERQVHDWAELRYAVDTYEPDSDACNAVLAELDMMDMNLLTKEDVPVLLEALATTEYESVLSSLGGSDVLERRKRALRAHPFYSPFCG